MASHAEVRAQERYGFTPNGRWFRRVLNAIREKRAKLAGFGNTPGSLIYDVPTSEAFAAGLDRDIVRVVVDQQVEHVVTVVPPTTPSERRREAARQDRKRRQQHFRSLRGMEQDDNE